MKRRRRRRRLREKEEAQGEGGGGKRDEKMFMGISVLMVRKKEYKVGGEQLRIVVLAITLNTTFQNQVGEII